MAALINATALDGDTIDSLVWRHTGKGASAVDAVLVANPQLADAGVFLPRGQLVTIPAAAQGPAIRPQIQLWS